MADWSPKHMGIGAVANTLAGSATGEYKEPETQLPEIGDTMKIVASPYSYHVYIEGQEVRPNSKIIEVQVTAIKNAKVIFE